MTLGRILCWLGLHDLGDDDACWPDGSTHCRRKGCRFKAWQSW